MANPIPALPRSTFPKPVKKRIADRGFWIADNPLSAIRYPLILSFLFITGCGPEYTYPSDQVPQSIEKICEKENQMDVEARVVGKTVGALLYTKAILDSSGQVPKQVHEEMGKVMMAVTRVALSTNLPLDFCVVVIRDKKHPMELVVTRSLDDTKRANADMIGIEESINRTLFGQNKAPLGSPFVLKEVTLEKFLADQIVQRVRFGLVKELKSKKDAKAPPAAEEEDEKPLILVDGAFDTADGRRVFRFSVLSLKQDDPRQTTLSMFKIVQQVFQGYHYDAFDSIEVRDYLNRQKLVVDKDTFASYGKKQMTDDELLDRYLVESKAAQEAFKLFGFNTAFVQDEDSSDLNPPIDAEEQE